MVLEILDNEVRFDASVGERYYAYERKNKEKFLSIISNVEWDYHKYDLQFCYSVILLPNGSWEKVDE